MKFWDASAVVPLVVAEASRPVLQRILRDDPAMLVWWGTMVESVSALTRRVRERAMTPASLATAVTQLTELSQGWHEVAPTEPVRTLAIRLLRVHDLRAADSFQLAAALTAAEGAPGSLEFVSLDDRLNDAAEREGFRVVAA